ncbi:MAG TPA: hypothetical protein VIV60_22695 [Polyangiaceae bacterium]
MPLPPELTRLAVLLAVVSTLVGCGTEIGAKCTTGTDCSQTGGRVCDTTMPSGYCTIPNCDPDSCPDEAACIAFVTGPSTAPVCQELHETRTVRAFCMRRCSSQGDCRSGYVCQDVSQTDWAERIDKSSKDARVCTVSFTSSLAAQDSESTAEYCSAAYASGGAPNAIGEGGAGNTGGNAMNVAGAAGAISPSGSAGSAGQSSLLGSAGTAGTSWMSLAGASGTAGAGFADDVSHAGTSGASFAEDAGGAGATP